MPKLMWWWIAGVATLLILTLVGLTFVVTSASEARVPADPHWAALATQQQAAFLRTRTAPEATRTEAPTARQTVAALTPTAIAGPILPPSPAALTPTATLAPAVTPEPTPSPEPTNPPAEPTFPTGVLATVGVPVLNLRTGPGLNFPIIATLPRGTAVALLGGREFADAYVWVEVTVDGRRGWLLGEPVGVR
jgi:hypothetical protein